MKLKPIIQGFKHHDYFFKWIFTDIPIYEPPPQEKKPTSVLMATEIAPTVV